MQDQIETYLNSNQSLAAAGMWKQKRNIGKGEGPIYRTSAEMGEIPEAVHPEDDGDEWKRDVLDTLGKIDPEDEIDKVLLNHFYWGWTYQELSDMLGVSVSTVHRHKVSLYERFLELTR
jgi:DNA-directed RNA polymerase specialized sigma24 family protein